MVDKTFALKLCAAILWCLCSLAECRPGNIKSTCGYESCHPIKEGFINVHLVPHTHDDVGWLKTVDQYYYGQHNYIQNAAVQYILDSVMQSLAEDKNRRFIYVESAFWWKWWMEQDDATRHKMQQFVRNGQLEFIGGAWSMNDEATTHYQSIIDQFTWGLRKLNDTFGECGRPKIGWQIDPFGHSREMASIFAQLGFDGLLLGRIDYQDKDYRFRTKTPEFIWQGSDNLGDKAALFTSIMYNTYSPPPGFCFDVLCGDDPIIDNKKSASYNADKRVQQFFDYLNNVTKVYATNNIIITMGEDFNYQYAHTWFKNLDRLILYGNKRQEHGSKYNLIYSTPSCYLKAVQDEAKNKIQWTVKTDDFFPYASDQHAVWTGYFTSRPTLKRFERLGNNFLQVCKQLYALADLGPEDWVDLDTLREAMGIMQHHDAVTGTEKQHVANDYAKILSGALDKCQFVAASALSKIIAKNKVDTERTDPLPEIDFQSCLLSNISQCNITEKSSDFVVTVYNPLSRNVSFNVRLPVTGIAYKVMDYAGSSIPVQLMPIPQTVLKIPGRASNATAELIFVAEDIPPLGFQSYYISRIAGDQRVKPKVGKKYSYGNNIQIDIDEYSGKLVKIQMNNRTVPLTQDFFYYRGMVGNNMVPLNRSSGAYIFRPNGTQANTITEQVAFNVYEGPLVSELHQVFNEWTSQIIRIYSNENYVEFDWLIGPLPQDDTNGKEVITRYATELKTNGTFYTDSNGREMLKRVRNWRPTWTVKMFEPIAGNYYPVTSKVLVRDPSEDLEVAILNDRSQGGTSLQDGEIELMLHRYCIHDDAFGVNEELEEKAFGKGLVVRGNHYLVSGSYLKNEGKSLAAQERDIAQRKLLQAWTFVSDTSGLTYDEYKNKYKMRYSGLLYSLPDNVQILTLEPWKGRSFLLRLEHVLEKNEDPDLSKSVTVNLKDLFVPYDIIWYNETTLGANQWLKDNYKTKQESDRISLTKHKAHRAHGYSREDLEWHSNGMETNDIYAAFSKYHYTLAEKESLDFLVKLDPMQIRTFIVEVQKKNSDV